MERQMSKRILMVEDDIDIGKMYASQLQINDHVVMQVRDAQSALDACDEYEFDVVVLDILLPGSNGLAVLQELRSYSDWRYTPVIILSNLTPDDLAVDDHHLEDLGVKKYLIKLHTTPQDLAAAVGVVCEPA